MKILVLNGINLNMFGKRDPAQYGTVTLAEIDARVQALGRELGAEVECFQTNHEGEMAERIHRAHAEGWSAAAGVQLNIFDGLLREGQVNAAKGSLASERSRLYQQELAVQVEVKEAILGVREASQSIAAAQEGVGRAGGLVVVV